VESLKQVTRCCARRGQPDREWQAMGQTRAAFAARVACWRDAVSGALQLRPGRRCVSLFTRKGPKEIAAAGRPACRSNQKPARYQAIIKTKPGTAVLKRAGPASARVVLFLSDGVLKCTPRKYINSIISAGASVFTHSRTSEPTPAYDEYGGFGRNRAGLRFPLARWPA